MEQRARQPRIPDMVAFDRAMPATIGRERLLTVVESMIRARIRSQMFYY